MKKHIISIVLAFSLLLSSIPAYAEEHSFVGSGTSEDPYRISSVKDFMAMSDYPNAYYLQMCDIDFSSVDNYASAFDSTTQFGGNYNGNGFKLKNITINADDIQYIGIWGYSKGTITGVYVTNCNIKTENKVSALYVGSLVGYNSGNVSECKSDAVIIASTKGENLSLYSGGLIGYSTKEVKKCEFSGSVESSVNYINSVVYAAGITGRGSSTDSTNKGTIKSTGFSTCDAYAGGISSSGYCYNCFNSGTVSAINAKNAYAGGISGSGSPKSCKNTGSIYGETKYGCFETYCGGVTGNGSPTFCENYGPVYAYSTSSPVQVGGISGQGGATDCKNFGAISGQSTGYGSIVGGVVGRSYYGALKRCVNYGSVTMLDNGEYSCGMPGGVCGELQYSTCIQCCNYGDVIVSGATYATYAGGVAGGCSGTIIDCFNKGDISINYETTPYSGNYVKNETNAGGIFAGRAVTCTYCYNYGLMTTVDSAHTLGGIHANNGSESNTIEYCYVTNSYEDELAIVLSEENTKLQSSYENFDFDDVWAIDPEANGGTPYLKTLATDDDANWYLAYNSVVSVTGITMPSTLSIAVADEVPVSIIVFPGNASNRAYSLSSDNEEVVTIKSNGIICGIAEGSATVTAITTDGGYEASCVVTVSGRAENEYTINSISVKSLSGDLLTSIPQSQCWVTVSITHNVAVGNSSVLLATYDANGRYIDMMAMMVEDMPEGSTIKNSLMIDNSDGNIASIKAFSVSSLSVLTPLGTAVTFK